MGDEAAAPHHEPCTSEQIDLVPVWWDDIEAAASADEPCASEQAQPAPLWWDNPLALDSAAGLAASLQISHTQMLRVSSVLSAGCPHSDIAPSTFGGRKQLKRFVTGIATGEDEHQAFPDQIFSQACAMLPGGLQLAPIRTGRRMRHVARRQIRRPPASGAQPSGSTMVSIPASHASTSPSKAALLTPALGPSSLNPGWSSSGAQPAENAGPGLHYMDASGPASPEPTTPSAGGSDSYRTAQQIPRCSVTSARAYLPGMGLIPRNMTQLSSSANALQQGPDALPESPYQPFSQPRQHRRRTDSAPDGAPIGHLANVLASLREQEMERTASPRAVGPQSPACASPLASLLQRLALQEQAAIKARQSADCNDLQHRSSSVIQLTWTDLAGQQQPSMTAAMPCVMSVIYGHRRLAVREAWANKAQVPGISAARFILSEDERTPQVSKEIDVNGDVAFLDHKTNYKSILYKTYFVLEYAVTHYDVRFILKTDDDAFINVVPLISQLKLLCETPGCKNERVYMGRMAQRSEVMLQPGHKWNNEAYLNHTGLSQYPNYMMGGGYILSGDVATALVNINHRMSLKFTPIEDATVAFWLMPIDLRHIDHPRFFTWAQPCCFKAPVRREGQRIVTRFQLADEMENDLCSDDPWLVLHKIDSPTKMRFIGNRVAECSFEESDPNKIAPSIAPYIKRTPDADEPGRTISAEGLQALGEAAQGLATDSGNAASLAQPRVVGVVSQPHMVAHNKGAA
ncbi:hypothetical protein WJX84_001984 [Apatococcus fuscideae]|uniref:Uncharacterized protein n=1 Tax=Apatococcus fuscideae TaxID=2026836 RepID=A0AAW1TKI1_9CHLO